MNHDDKLYPHWLKVREALQNTGLATIADARGTTGEIATAVVEALRPQLMNDTVEMTWRLHVGAQEAGWFDTLRAFVRMARTLHGGDHIAFVAPLPRDESRDGFQLTHVLLLNLPGEYEPLQVSWRLRPSEAAALIEDGARDSTTGFPAPRWDGHDREEKYRRLRAYAEFFRRKDQR